jgi:macrolide-specific efflux system membrane fusion protein
VLVRISLRGRRRAWLVVPVVLVVAACSGAWLMTRDSSAAVQPTTATVSSSTMKETVAASGTVEPARSADLDFSATTWPPRWTARQWSPATCRP